jgi:putative acetyltransferase
MIVRRERPGDVGAVRSVQVAAFRRGNDDPLEARLLDELRACSGWIERFSMVAEVDGGVAGHVVCTRAHVGDVRVLALGPIAVLPGRQRAGIGLAMMHAMIGAADAADEPLIGLLGSPDYYRRFGFVSSADLQIHPPEPEWGPYFQVRPLAAYGAAISGEFAYAAPFRDVT